MADLEQLQRAAGSSTGSRALVLSDEERRQAVERLANLHYLSDTPAARRALVESAGLHDLVGKLEFTGNQITFAGQLISLTEPYGRLPEAPSLHALGALLTYFIGLSDVPPNDVAFFALLVVKYSLASDPAYVQDLRARYGIHVAALLPPGGYPIGPPLDASLDLYRDRPRQHFEPELTLVPAGSFLMGNDNYPSESPSHLVSLDDFFIGVYPTTNEEYAAFVWATRRVADPEMGWDGNKPPDDQMRYPVTGVTWHEALAYCRWLTEQTGRAYTLPTEAQWEKAARGADGRVFPWGNDWQGGRCHIAEDQLSVVDAFPAQSVYGCFDLVGNAREWTLTNWGRDPKTPDARFVYPWRDDRRNDTGEPATTRRVFRGGPANTPEGYRCSARGGFLPDKPGPRGKRMGFRVVVTAR